MAKLPATSMAKMDPQIKSFESLTKIRGFKFEDFENRAEALEIENPGNGYDLAYQETMSDMFGALIDRHARYEDNVPTLSEFVYYYDNILMKGYFAERGAQNLGVNVKTNPDGPRLETLENLKKVLDEHSATPTMTKVQNKFASGEYTLDNTYDMAKAKASTTPTRQEALELVSCAAYLEKRNQERSVFGKLRHLYTHIKELFAIRKMKTLASKCDTIANLKYEASKESSGLSLLRNMVEDGLFIKRNAARPVFTEATVKDIESGYTDWDKNLDFENALDESVDLDGEIVADDADGKDLFGDESNLEDIQGVEKVEFNEEDIDIFPKDIEAKSAEIKEPTKNKNISK